MGDESQVLVADEQSSETISGSGSSRSRSDFKVYHERWYILVVCSTINMMQSAVYNTFGPISNSCAFAFHLTQTDIALLPNWTNIVFFMSFGPFVYIMSVKGLRLPVLITACFVWAGCGARILHIGDDYRGFFHLGQFLNGIANPFTFFSCTSVSSVWFPPEERVLATGILLLTGNFGIGLSYVIGPLFVEWFAVDKTDPNSVKQAIIILLTVEYLMASALVVIVIFSFRSKPTTPPSFTASIERVSIKSAVKIICSSIDAWFVIIVYSLPSGILGGWLAILSWVLRKRVVEVEAGWIGLASQMAGAAAGLMVSAAASRLRNRLKLLVVISYSLCCLLISWHVVTYHFLSNFYTHFGLWVCIVGTTSCMMSSQPLLWESCCEHCYPASESVVSAVLSLGNSLVSTFLLIVAMVPSLGTAWIDWAVVASFWLSLPMLLWFKPVQRRSALDD